MTEPQKTGRREMARHKKQSRCGRQGCTWATVLVALLVIVFVAACGGMADEDPEDATSGDTVTEVEDNEADPEDINGTEDTPSATRVSSLPTPTAEADSNDGSESLSSVQLTATALAFARNATPTAVAETVAEIALTATALAVTADNTPIDPPPPLVNNNATQLPTAMPTATANAEVMETVVIDTDATATLLAQATRIASNTEAPVVAPAGAAADERLGNAEVYPFYNDRLAYPDTMTVELQLILDEWFVTPTPFGAITAIAANPDVTRPAVVADPDEDVTPRPARLVDELRSVPPFVVAELDCSDVVFVGCTRKAVRALDLQGINAWIWNVQPIDETRSQQAMTLRLFRADADGNILSQTPLWQHNFSVEVGTPLTLGQLIAQNAAFVIAGGVLLLAALLGGVVGYRRYSAGALAGKQPLQGVRVFISYRRKFTWSAARKINDDLERHGATSFIDVDDIHEGDFSQYIRDNIAQCDYFVVVLAPHTLDSKWVIQEIQLARKHNKPVIPVLVDGFDLYADSMPESVRDLRDDNAVTMNPEYYDAAIQKLVTFMSPDTPSNAG